MKIILAIALLAMPVLAQKPRSATKHPKKANPPLTLPTSGLLEGFSASHDDHNAVVPYAWLTQDSPSSSQGRIDRLSDEEYARLQKLRQAVKDAETEIAKAHGVDFGQAYVPPRCLYSDMGCMAWDKTTEVQARAADRYEYRGQFLLVNVPGETR